MHSYVYMIEVQTMPPRAHHRALLVLSLRHEHDYEHTFVYTSDITPGYGSQDTCGHDVCSCSENRASLTRNGVPMRPQKL